MVLLDIRMGKREGEVGGGASNPEFSVGHSRVEVLVRPPPENASRQLDVSLEF